MKQVNQSDDGAEQEREISRRLTDRLSDLAYQQGNEGLQIVELHENEVLFEQGDEGESVYVLKAGALGVRIKLPDGSEAVIARLAPGAIVGEMALLSGSKRSATVFAINDAGLIRLSQEQFEQLMEEDESAFAAVSATAVPRWQRQQLFNALNILLGEVDASELDVLRERMAWQYYANGDLIFRQGDPSDGMYLVVNGRLRTMLTLDDGSEMDLGEIGPGQPVGEMGVLTGAARSATVHAVRESNLVKIMPAQFGRLIRQYPELMINIARVIVERQQRMMQGSVAARVESLTFAVIPGNAQLDATLFAQELGRSLGRYGSALALNGDDFDEKYGEIMASQTELDGVGNTAIVAFMNELDLAEQYILYVADPFPSAWTRRCIAHADRVLILVDPAGTPEPGDAERMLDEMEVPLRSHLLFWNPATMEAPQDVSAWLEPRTTDVYHFVRQGDAEQMDELVERALK